MTGRLWQRNLIGTGVAAVTLTAITWFTLLPAWGGTTSAPCGRHTSPPRINRSRSTG